MLESAILELGRTGKGVQKLIEILQSKKLKRGRAEAALALGAVGGEKAVSELFGALEDRDPWVRYSADKALRSLKSVTEMFCDWIYATKMSRKRGVKRWKEILGR